MKTPAFRSLHIKKLTKNARLVERGGRKRERKHSGYTAAGMGRLRGKGWGHTCTVQIELLGASDSKEKGTRS